ncbi:transcriptional regulator [compost metagenome]
MKILTHSPQVLVASSTLLQRFAQPTLPADLSALPSLHWGCPQPHYAWHLNGPDGATATVNHQPQLVSDDMNTLKNAALAGVGAASLPLRVVKDELDARLLVELTPQWRPVEGVITAVFPSRRGLLPSVRSLIDFLGKAIE